MSHFSADAHNSALTLPLASDVIQSRTRAEAETAVSVLWMQLLRNYRRLDHQVAGNSPAHEDTGAGAILQTQRQLRAGCITLA